MAKVSDIIFCLNATNLPGQGVCANNILTAITPEYIPGLFTFSVIITLLDLSTSKEQQMQITLSVDDEEVARIEGLIPIIEVPSNLPDCYKGLNLTIDWNNIDFKKSGEYVLQVIIDGNQIGEKKIFVKGKNQT